MLGHKTSCSAFKEIVIKSSTFLDHNTVRMEINNKKKTAKKPTNAWRLKSMLVNNQWDIEEIIKGRNKWNRDYKNNRKKWDKTKSQFSERINNIDKPLARVIEKKREQAQIKQDRNEKGETTNDITETQRIIKRLYKQLYTSKMDNLEEMDKLLERYNLPRMNQEWTENMNRSILSVSTVMQFNQ